MNSSHTGSLSQWVGFKWKSGKVSVNVCVCVKATACRFFSFITVCLKYVFCLVFSFLGGIYLTFSVIYLKVNNVKYRGVLF